MKIHQIIGLSVFFIATGAAAANHTNLTQTREQVAMQYVQYLQSANYKGIAQLFEKNGIVVSTSRGKVDAKEFFYAFLPNIRSAKTELHQFYINAQHSNHLVARFFFSFDLKDGEKGHGEYVDEFVFADNSAKLSAVYMFENLKFDGIIDSSN